MIDLSGRAAVVTGGSRGIGEAICVALAHAGADVAFGYRADDDAAQAVAGKIRGLGRQALSVRGDMASMADCRALFEAAAQAFGGVDILVCNAGVWKRAPIETMTEQQWRASMAVNLDAVFNICRLAAGHMKRRKTGKIIVVGSTAGQRGEAYYAHYAAAKGAVIAFVRSLAAELGPDQINVNCVAPGWVRTDMTAGVFADAAFTQATEASIPLQRIAEPEDVAGPVLFLASDLARHVQGAVLNVNGGSVLC